MDLPGAITVVTDGVGRRSGAVGLIATGGGGVENTTGVIGKDNGGGEDIAITGGTVVTAAIACPVD